MVGDRIWISSWKSRGTRTILIKSKEKTTEEADYTCPNLLAASELIVKLGLSARSKMA